MYKLLCVFLLAFPFSLQAETIIDLQSLTCSGELLQTTDDELTFSCSGNLNVSGGIIKSDLGINFSALVDAFFEDVSITGKYITITADNSIVIGYNTSFKADGVPPGWLGSHDHYPPYVILPPLLPVPEPTTYALTLLGLGIITIGARRKTLTFSNTFA